MQKIVRSSMSVLQTWRSLHTTSSFHFIF